MGEGESEESKEAEEAVVEDGAAKKGKKGSKPSRAGKEAGKACKEKEAGKAAKEKEARKAVNDKEPGKPKPIRVRSKPDPARKKALALEKQLSQLSDDNKAPEVEECDESPESPSEEGEPRQDTLSLKLMDVAITYGDGAGDAVEMEDGPLPLQALDMEQEISELLKARACASGLARGLTGCPPRERHIGMPGEEDRLLSEADRSSLCVVGRGIRLLVDVPNLPDDAVEGMGMAGQDEDCLTGEVMLVDGCAVPITPMPPSCASCDLTGASTDWLALYTSEMTQTAGTDGGPQPPTPVCAALIDAFMPPPAPAAVHGF